MSHKTALETMLDIKYPIMSEHSFHQKYLGKDYSYEQHLNENEQHRAIATQVYEDGQLRKEAEMYAFAVWYSGMEESKIRTAHKRFLYETNYGK